jgi:hypothetical protein
MMMVRRVMMSKGFHMFYCMKDEDLRYLKPQATVFVVTWSNTFAKPTFPEGHPKSFQARPNYTLAYRMSLLKGFFYTAMKAKRFSTLRSSEKN